MVAFELEGVEVDRCVVCGGTWLDAGELEMIAGLSGVEVDGLVRALADAKGVRGGRRGCPRCRRRLRQIALSDTPIVHLDRCPRGHGIWCDRGEMETVIRSYAGEQGAVVARFFAELYKSEVGPGEKGG